ncbi:MAG TPA: phospholipase D-like domain-containing protein, partial [Ornithinibacter sp.]|nr:phospholipase D-like domain-containing protein [Ornithinibacter sp.]
MTTAYDGGGREGEFVPRLFVLLTLCLVLGTPQAAVPAVATPGAGTSAAAQPGLAPAKVTAADRERWKAPQGPFFNDPRLKKGWFRIERKVIETIKHTPRGSTIRIAVYSFDRMPVAKALIAAHRRGVKVQMILNDHQYTKAMRAVRREIGARRYRSSFITRCTAGCRSKQNQYNNMHTKFYSFSRAGRSKDVLAVGSANLMLNADKHQW